MFTITNDITNEIIIKNSRFICVIHKIYDVNNIDDYLNNIKSTYKDANHYCYAYIIDDKKKFSDDGEPSGTAGNPMLQVLDKNNLNYVLCVVIRYFGGIKLGAGGLVRAYTKSITQCLENANIRKLVYGYNIDIKFNYEYVNNVNYLLKNSNILNKKFSDKIICNLNVDYELYNELHNDKHITIKIIKEIKIEK